MAAAESTNVSAPSACFVYTNCPLPDRTCFGLRAAAAPSKVFVERQRLTGEPDSSTPHRWTWTPMASNMAALAWSAWSACSGLSP